MKAPALFMILLSVSAVLKPAIDAPTAWRHFRAYPQLVEGKRLAKLGAWQEAKQHFIAASYRDPGNMKIHANQLYADLALHDWHAVKQQTGLLLANHYERDSDWYLYRAMATYALGEHQSARLDVQKSMVLSHKISIITKAKIILAALDSPPYDKRTRLKAQTLIDTPDVPKPDTPEILWGPAMSFQPDQDQTAQTIRFAAFTPPQPLSIAHHETADTVDLAAQGYTALARGDTEAALLAFSHAPHTAQNTAQLAYIEQTLGNNKAAKKDFEEAVALSGPGPQRSVWLSQLAPLAKKLGIASQIFVRLKQIDPRIAGAQTALGLSGNYSQANLRLNGDPDRPLTAIATFASGIDGNTLRIDRTTAQAGLGLSWKPFADINAHVDAIRLFALGTSARKDWELRLGIGAGRGYGPEDGDSTWLHWQTNADVALIGFKKRDVFAAANARVGMGWAFADRWALTPYIGLNGTFQASGRTATQVEFSPGLWLHHSLRPAGTSGADIRLEYRRKLLGNAAAANGATVVAAVNF